MIITALVVAVLEIFATVLLVRQLGLQNTCLLYGITSGIGVVIWRLSRKRNLKLIEEMAQVQEELKKQHGKSSVEIALEKPDYRRKLGEVTNSSMSIFLILIPGILTTILGYLLLTPFVRRNFNPIYGRSPRASRATGKQHKNSSN